MYWHKLRCLSYLQGLVAIAQVGNGTADSSSAAWPGINTFYSKSTALDRQRDSIAQAAAGTPRLTVAGVTKLLSAGGADLSSSDATLFQVRVDVQALPDEACTSTVECRWKVSASCCWSPTLANSCMSCLRLDPGALAVTAPASTKYVWSTTGAAAALSPCGPDRHPRAAAVAAAICSPGT